VGLSDRCFSAAGKVPVGQTPSLRAASLATPILDSVDDDGEITIVAARSRGAIGAADRAALARAVRSCAGPL
jgi:hypothetical protein